MRHFYGAVFLLLSPLTALVSQTTILPEVLNGSETVKSPFAYNGLISTNIGIGSASLVESGVIVTAAHVIFDDENLVWAEANTVRFFPQNHSTLPVAPYKGYLLIAFTRWTSYETRVDNDGSGSGLSSPDTFNIDFAAGHLSPYIRSDKIDVFPEVYVDVEEPVSILRDTSHEMIVGILRDNRDKMIVGYPADNDFIPINQVGLMHRTAPGDYFCFWSGLEDRPEDTWRDSEDFWVATYEFEGVNTYSGNSGGPIYVKDDEDEWVLAGIVVGSIGSTGVLIRGIDEGAWEKIGESISARGKSDLKRVTDLTATQTPDFTILLAWSGNPGGDTAYLIYRLDGDLWEAIDSVQPGQSSYEDVNVLPGHVYHYRVQAVAENGTRAPKSNPVAVATEGSSALAANYFEQPWLSFVSKGDSNWFVDDSNRLRAGKVRSLGKSTLRLDIIGPGTLDFTWSVSSEVNPDYDPTGDPDAQNIYDAAYLSLNGAPVLNGDEPVFLSGFIDPTARQLVLPAGSNSIEWSYEKDPYSTEGEDTAFLQALAWTPDPSAPYPVLGGFALEEPVWHSSTWFGPYVVTGTPWVDHSELGWLYLRPGNGIDLFFYCPHPELGDLYTNPSIFPYVYHVGRGVWLYYFEASGSFGQHLWFYDSQASESFRIN